MTWVRLCLVCSLYLVIQPLPWPWARGWGNPHSHLKNYIYGPFPSQPQNQFSKSRHLQEVIKTSIRRQETELGNSSMAKVLPTALTQLPMLNSSGYCFPQTLTTAAQDSGGYLLAHLSRFRVTAGHQLASCRPRQHSRLF